MNTRDRQVMVLPVIGECVDYNGNQVGLSTCISSKSTCPFFSSHCRRYSGGVASFK